MGLDVHLKHYTKPFSEVQDDSRFFVVTARGELISAHDDILDACDASTEAGDNARVIDALGIVYSIHVVGFGGGSRIQAAQKRNSEIRAQLRILGE